MYRNRKYRTAAMSSSQPKISADNVTALVNYSSFVGSASSTNTSSVLQERNVPAVPAKIHVK